MLDDMPSLAEARSLGVSKVEYETVLNNTNEMLNRQNRNRDVHEGNIQP